VSPKGRPVELFDVRLGGRSVDVTLAVLPGPLEEGTAVAGFDKEAEAALKALGYVD
jgi:hypothetical protein